MVGDKRSRGKIVCWLGCTRIRTQDVRNASHSPALKLGKSESKESPCKEELVLQWESDRVYLAGTVVRSAMEAGKEDDWPELSESGEINPPTEAKLQECYHEVKQDDDQRNSIVLQILQKRSDVPRRIIVPVQGQGGVTLSHVCPHSHRFPMGGPHLVGCMGNDNAIVGCASWSYKTARTPAKLFRAHAPPQGACENLVCAWRTSRLGETAAHRGRPGSNQIEYQG